MRGWFRREGLSAEKGVQMVLLFSFSFLVSGRVLRTQLTCAFGAGRLIYSEKEVDEDDGEARWVDRLGRTGQDLMGQGREGQGRAG